MSPPSSHPVPDAAARLALSGRLDATTVAGLWESSLAFAAGHADRAVVVDVSGVDYIDGAGLALLAALQQQPRARSAPLTIEGLPARFQPLVEEYVAAGAGRAVPPPPAPPGWIEQLGRSAESAARGFRDFLVFLGRATAATLHAILHPSSVRWSDAVSIAVEAGIHAIPIVSLIAFLMGVILAFQAAIAMRQFGATIFVADLVALSITRELGPLLTAILLAGRTGAAFAAELGTMKVNEEIDAIETMGLSAMQFLVVPRILAGVTVTPVLAVLSVVIGILSGGLVMGAFDISFAAYFREATAALLVADFLGGIAKAYVFGVIVAGVGCLRGLQTRSGAAAVGLSTTSAVVTGIVLIVVADGVFAVVYYYLGI